MKNLSIIIPYLNDVETLVGTLDSLYETIDIDNFEVVVVDDGSDRHDRLPTDYKRPHLKHARHFTNLGVGQAFDTGVNVAEGDNIILMGSDIRFYDNGWASRMLKVIDAHPKSIVATRCDGQTGRAHYGADVIFYIRNQDVTERHPCKKINSYTAVLEGKWRPRTGRGVYAVPSLMGAFYGVKRSWYEYVKGFELHYKWGVLEPYISLKTWKMGGSVLVDSDNGVQHIWRKPRRTLALDALAYNELLIAQVVFHSYGTRYANFLYESKTPFIDPAVAILEHKIEPIGQLARYVQSNQVMTSEELERKMVDMSHQYHRESNHYLNPIK